jgi:hypothetical protein
MELPMKRTDGIDDVRETPTVISDSEKVQIGNYTPLFPPLLRDRPSNVSDGGKVQIGDYSPALPPLRSR